MSDVYVEFISALLEAAATCRSADFAQQYASGAPWAVNLRQKLVDLAGDISNQVADSVELVTEVKRDLYSEPAPRGNPGNTPGFTLMLDDDDDGTDYMRSTLGASSSTAERHSRLLGKISNLETQDPAQVERLRQFAAFREIIAEDDDDFVSFGRDEVADFAASMVKRMESVD